MSSNPTIRVALSWQGPTMVSGQDQNLSADRLRLTLQDTETKLKVLIPNVLGDINSHLQFCCSKNDRSRYVDLLSLKVAKMPSLQIFLKSSLDFPKEPGQVGELGFNRSTSKRGLTLSEEPVPISLPKKFEEGKLYCITIQSTQRGDKLFLEANLKQIENASFNQKIDQDLVKYAHSEIIEFLHPLLSQLNEQYFSFMVERHNSHLRQSCPLHPSTTPTETFIQTLFQNNSSKRIEILALIRNMRSDVKKEETLSGRSRIQKRAIETFLDLIGKELVVKSCKSVFESAVCPEKRDQARTSIEQNVATWESKIYKKYLTHLPKK
jgi:hypothetical protein